MALIKSTIWLDADEIEQLDELAKRRWRTRSALIREGIRLVIESEQTKARTPETPADDRWMTRQELVAVVYMNAHWPVSQLAQELRVTVERAEEIDRSMRRKLSRKD